MKKTFAVALVASIALLGCANPYTKYYAGRYYPRTRSCIWGGIIYSPSDKPEFIQEYQEIGRSGFPSTERDDFDKSAMLRACKSVGGDAVVVLMPQAIGTYGSGDASFGRSGKKTAFQWSSKTETEKFFSAIFLKKPSNPNFGSSSYSRKSNAANPY